MCRRRRRWRDELSERRGRGHCWTRRCFYTLQGGQPMRVLSLRLSIGESALQKAVNAVSTVCLGGDRQVHVPTGLLHHDHARSSLRVVKDAPPPALASTPASAEDSATRHGNRSLSSLRDPPPSGAASSSTMSDMAAIAIRLRSWQLCKYTDATHQCPCASRLCSTVVL